MAWFSERIQPKWKFLISVATINRLTTNENFENATNLIFHDHHLVKYSKFKTLDKLPSTEIHSTLISRTQCKPSPIM